MIKQYLALVIVVAFSAVAAQAMSLLVALCATSAPEPLAIRYVGKDHQVPEARVAQDDTATRHVISALTVKVTANPIFLLK